MRNGAVILLSRVICRLNRVKAMRLELPVSRKECGGLFHYLLPSMRKQAMQENPYVTLPVR